MAKRFAFTVLLQIETNDPRLSEEALAAIHESAANTARIRHAVLQHLPRDVQRLIAILPVKAAKHLMLLHDAIGEELLGESPAHRPPADYVPPTTE